MLTVEHIKAARMLLGWDQASLAERSGVPLSTLKRVESRPGLVRAHTRTAYRLQQALEQAGISFFQADAHGGIGVRLRDTPQGQDDPKGREP